MLQAISRMHAAAPNAVLAAKSNAGVPELEDGKAVYRAGPETMAEFALAARARGARIIGGCCGTRPEHIRAMADALAQPTSLDDSIPSATSLDDEADASRNIGKGSNSGQRRRKRNQGKSISE